MKVALLANLKHNAPTWPAMPPGQWDHLETWSTIDALTLALNQGGHYVIFLEGDETLYNNLQAVKPDICFNLCQGHFGEARKTYVPGILEMLHLPYTGSQTFTLALNKSTTKRFLIHHGLPTPPFVVLERAEELVDIELELPVLVQSLRAELYSKTKQVHLIQKRSDFEAHTQYLLETYQQPVLAEKFIEGREITLGIVGNLSSPVARRLPPNQQSQTIGQGLHILPAVERFISLEQLGQSLQPSICPADLPEAQLEELKWLAAAAFRVIGCLDVAQITFRLEAKEGDKPYIVDIDTFPRLYPEQAPLCQAALAYGWSYEELIIHILDEALTRYRLNSPRSEADPLYPSKQMQQTRFLPQG